ncbi:MAG: hypothetical protein O9289_15365 [Rhodobacteraceae bacterium]|nr:hypothetical protein [Paracoccaceae bacterium]MCZ8084574.1 hypothetical protein [Paracoccaceae bacterium]
MDSAAAIWAVLAAATAGVVLVLLRRAQAARAARRGAFLGAATVLFKQVRIELAATGFPRLAGRRGGAEFDIQVVPDTLSVRKLPALWVLVSLPGPLPVTGTLDVLLRPTGMETFTNFSRLPVQVQPPPGFPPDCAIRTDAPRHAAFANALREVMETVDTDRLKEILITPAGVRLVFLAEEADRGRYLLFRDAEMGRDPLPPARLIPFLAAALALRSAVMAETEERRSA